VGARPRSDQRPRPPLNRQQVLAAAIALADEEGLAAVSMRRLGERLGVEAMSLYNHVANKDDIVDGIADAVLDLIELPSDCADWKVAMRRRAASLRIVLSQHPWAAALTGTRSRPGPVTLRYADWVLGCLMKAGFSPDMASRAFWVLDSYIYGFVSQEAILASAGPAADEQGEYTRSQSVEEYPYLIEASKAYAAGPGWDFDEEFAFGLDLVLDAHDRQLQQPLSPS
jgi:AcrR family transcriptional regulator